MSQAENALRDTFHSCGAGKYCLWWPSGKYVIRRVFLDQTLRPQNSRSLEEAYSEYGVQNQWERS